MGYFSKASDQLGEATGKGIAWMISAPVLGFFGGIGAFFKWYRPSSWTLPPGKKDFLRHNTWRFAATAIIISLFTMPNLIRFSWVHPELKKGETYVLSPRLPYSARAAAIGFPPPAMFEPIKSGEDATFELNGFTYVRYEEEEDGKIPHEGARINHCLLIPAGKELFIHTDTPPIKALNMKVKVKFIPHVHQLRGVEKYYYKVRVYLLGEGAGIGRTWPALAREWSLANVGVKGYGLLATAADANDIPYPHAGGMACF